MLGRQKRKVRMYIEDGPTIEGVLTYRTRHEYGLYAPKIISGEKPDEAVVVSGHVEIPKDRVLFWQVIG